MSLRFLAVVPQGIAIPARQARVLCVVTDLDVGEILVRYTDRDGWTCQCPTEADTCPHVDAVDDVLDDRIFVQ